MMLYHASNVEVKQPMLVESNRMLDFGRMDARKFATYLAVVISPAVVGLLADALGVDEVTAMNRYFASSAYAALPPNSTVMQRGLPVPSS